MSDLKKTNNQKDNITKSKSEKTIDKTTTKSKVTFVKKIFNIFINIKKSFAWLIETFNSFISKYSLLTQSAIILIPFSLLCLMLIIFLHKKFFDELYVFNFTKGLKEDFLDYYITEMDDMHADIDTYVAKENYLDFENQLFFDVYYKELATIGVLDNPNIISFPNISDKSETLYLIFDENAKLLNNQDIFTIPKEKAKKYIDDRKEDSLGEFAKIYYYMIPIIGNGAFRMNVFINQTFFIAYEFDKNRKINNNDLYFKFPRKNESFYENENFSPSGDQLNPSIEEYSVKSKYLNNYYYNENWFIKQDKLFREKVDLSNDQYLELSFSHLNYEHNGNINKSLIISSQQYIKRNEKYYIINIVFFLHQNVLNNKRVEYSTFILQSNPHFLNIKSENEKYSDNETYVVLKSDITEYSLTNIDYQYFHFGLYDKYHRFYQNGIFFDSFNLDYLYNPLDFYSSVEDYDVDLRYLTTLYLYKSLFQSINYTIIGKRREEIYLYNFNDEERVKSICGEINLTRYINYIKISGINCLSTENNLYYDEVKFKNKNMIDIESKYPCCICLPLFCLENYENYEKDYDNINVASKINLPNKCQLNFLFYTHENDVKINYSSYEYKYNYFDSNIASGLILPNNNYIKFQLQNISQLPGYYFFIVAQIAPDIDLFLYYYYNLSSRIHINLIAIIILTLNSLICFIIIFLNFKRYSLIIEEFKQKFEIFLFQTEDNMNNNNSISQTNNDHNKNSITEEYMPFLENENYSENNYFNINENALFHDLFSIFCKYYNVSINDIEKYHSHRNHETKNQMNLKMMMEKNELFKLLSMLSIYAPIFKLNISLDYNMYNYSIIMKKYYQNITKVININKKQMKLTQNILYELLSTENISDYGLVTNLHFNYISNIKAELKENSIQNAIFINIFNKRKGTNLFSNENEIEDTFLFVKDRDENKKLILILKKKNELMEIFKRKFESDD